MLKSTAWKGTFRTCSSLLDCESFMKRPQTTKKFFFFFFHYFFRISLATKTRVFHYQKALRALIVKWSPFFCHWYLSIHATVKQKHAKAFKKHIHTHTHTLEFPMRILSPLQSILGKQGNLKHFTLSILLFTLSSILKYSWTRKHNEINGLIFFSKC